MYNNVILLHISVTNNHHQADVSVHGHDMFSAYSMGSHIVYLQVISENILVRILNI